MAIEEASENLAHARKWVAGVAGKLPAQIDRAAVGVLDKAPFIVLCVREGLIWRVEELARNATEALERGDEAVGITLARSVTEAAAMMWRLLKLVEDRAEHGLEYVREDARRMWLGWKNDPGELPAAINILTMISHLNKAIPGVSKAYDHLSEFAHPNWNGVAGLYCKTDYEEHIVYFGHRLRGDHNTEAAAHLLVSALGVFEYAYERLAEVIAVWLSELEPF